MLLIGRTPENLAVPRNKDNSHKGPAFLLFERFEMVNTILGTKLNMTTKFLGLIRIPVTLISASPNVVLAVSDGKIQLGYGQKKKIKKTENAFVKAAGFAPKFVREVKAGRPIGESPESSKISLGDKITVSIFSPGDLVKVTATTKGRGFAGGVKRWGFAGGPKTHGQSDRHRAPGSIGQATTPGRVFKGKHMAGHMGVAKQTVTGLQVVEIDENKNLLVIKGAIPGTRNGFVVVEKTGKVKNYQAPAQQVQEEKLDEGVKAEEPNKTAQETMATEINAIQKEVKTEKSGTGEAKEKSNESDQQELKEIDTNRKDKDGQNPTT